MEYIPYVIVMVGVWFVAGVITSLTVSWFAHKKRK